MIFKFDLMKTKLIVLLISVIAFFTIQAFSQSWERLYPDFSDEHAWVAMRTVASDDGGQHLLIGMQGTLASEAYFYLLKLDENGMEQTRTSFVEGQSAKDLILAENGDLIVLAQRHLASDSFEIVFLRLDQAHNVLVEKTLDIAGQYQSPVSLSETVDGDYWLAGRGGEYPVSSFVAKLSATGDLIAGPRYEGFEYNHSVSVLVKADGGARVLSYGNLQNTYPGMLILTDFDVEGNFVEQFTFDNNGTGITAANMITTSDGSTLVAARTADSYNVPILMKVDALGSILWTKEYDFPGFLMFVDLIESDQGYKILFREQHPTFLLHTGLLSVDQSGEVLWKRQYQENYLNECYDIVGMDDGGALLTGRRSMQALNPNGGWTLPYLIRTDANGNTFDSGISGSVYNDIMDDCTGDQTLLSAGLPVSLFQDGLPIATGVVDDFGDYTIEALPEDYQLMVGLPNFLWSSCQDSMDVSLQSGVSITADDFVVAYNNEPLDSIYGYLFEDHDYDCLRDSFETIGYDQWIVNLMLYEDGNFTELSQLTDENGYYSFTDLSPYSNGADINLWFQAPIGTGLNCGIPCWQETAGLGPIAGTSLQFNNGMQCDTLPFCPIMSVSVFTDEIRPCVEEQYSVHYCNIGGETAIDAQLTLEVDQNLEVLGSSLAWDSVEENIYTFSLGNLLSNECGSFKLDFMAPCDDLFGTTYCTEANASPEGNCAEEDEAWDGSEIRLSVECVGDSLHFQIENIGEGDMEEPSEYIVIEDNVLLFSAPQMFDLDAGQSLTLSIPANGYAYHMAAEQSEGFPGISTPITWIEGCGDMGELNLGMINQYPLGDEDTWTDVFCLESTNAYDPNDKTGFPRGVGDQNYIPQNQPLEFLLRFQNTGSASALYVELQDQIDQSVLDLYSLRPGASSHPYTWDIDDTGTVIFKFENIDLPFEAEDEEGSKGFVSFTINQKADLSPGTVIENEAAIYFDFNPPIITNRTLHTIEQDIYALATSVLEVDPDLGLHCHPNPASDRLHFDLSSLPQEALQLEILDAFGRVVYAASLEKDRSDISVAKFTSGTYLFSLKSSEGSIYSGRFVKF